MPPFRPVYGGQRPSGPEGAGVSWVASKVGGATHICAKCGGKGYYLRPERSPEEHYFCGRCGGTGTRPKGQGGLFD